MKPAQNAFMNLPPPPTKQCQLYCYSDSHALQPQPVTLNAAPPPPVILNPAPPSTVILNPAPALFVIPAQAGIQKSLSANLFPTSDYSLCSKSHCRRNRHSRAAPPPTVISERSAPTHCHPERSIRTHCHPERSAPTPCHPERSAPTHCHPERSAPTHCHSERSAAE